MMKIPDGCRLQPFALLRRRGTHVPMVIDSHCSRDRIADTIRRGPVILQRLAWVVAHYRNSSRVEYVSVDTDYELIVAAAGRRQDGLCRNLPVESDTSVP
jgi:hypothetical protein